ncbi:MAG: hypothetical protein ACOCV0_00145 [Alkalispirochaeta sp.]
MNQIRRSIIFAVVIALAAVAPLTGQEIPLRSVTIFTSGVAEFVHEGTPDEAGRIVLSVPRSRMADVVRTLTVLDGEGRAVEHATFASGESVDTLLSRFRIDLGGVRGIVAFINEIRGTDATITTVRGDRVPGTVVGASGAGDSDRDREEAVVLIARPDGVRSVPIDTVQTVSFDDSAVQEEFTAALETLRSAGGPDAPRQITIQLGAGSGIRTGTDSSADSGGSTTIRYLAEAPVWKTSYRGVISGDEILFQGWAHIHNTGTVDWDEVELSIVSARPVTYSADLYVPEYVSRREPERTRSAQRSAISQSAAPAWSHDSSVPQPEVFSSSVAVSASEESFASGISFTFPEKVSIPRGRSAVVPIVNRRFPADAVRSYDPRRHGANPRLAVTFRNSDGGQLPDGIVTIYDGDRYGGDALLPPLFPDGEATLPYAVDVAHEVRAESDASEEELRRVSIVDGLLVEEFRSRRTTRYAVTRAGNAGRPEPIRITHEVPQGWELVTPRPLSSEGREHRFQTRGTGVTVVEERLRYQRVALTSADREQLLSYSGNRLIDPTVRRTLQNVAELRRQVEETSTARRSLELQVETIREEQTRIRENMAVLDRDSTLYRRYLSTLDDQEDRMVLLLDQLQDAREQQENAEAALTEYLRTLR